MASMALIQLHPDEIVSLKYSSFTAWEVTISASERSNTKYFNIHPAEKMIIARNSTLCRCILFEDLWCKPVLQKVKFKLD